MIPGREGQPRRGWPSSLRLSSLAAAFALGACAADAHPRGPLTLSVVTFNTGTTEGLAHDDPPDDGYTSAHAAVSDAHYGDGLAWEAAVADVAAFFAALTPDLVAFQEIFWPGDCPGVPADARAGFVCETWQAGDPSVARRVLGADYQVVCHPGKPDKCLAVHRRLGRFEGCDGDVCLEGALVGLPIPGCGSGARVARGVITLAGGGTLTVAHVHGSSGITEEDVACRRAQVDQLFVDLGDGAPAASGALNVVLGDLNTDPGRFADADPSAARWLDFVGPSRRFRWLTDIGPEARPTYAGFFNIDHVASDGLAGDCAAHGSDPGTQPPTEMVYFDHLPVVCVLAEVGAP